MRFDVIMGTLAMDNVWEMYLGHDHLPLACLLALLYVQVDFTLHHLEIPLSGRNPRFTSLIRRKPRILLLNKLDLSDPGKIQDAIKLLNLSGEKHVIPVDCRKQHCSNVRMVSGAEPGHTARTEWIKHVPR